MTTRDKLGPGPFCGSGRAEVTRAADARWHVSCPMCGAEGPLTDTSMQASASWDARSGADHVTCGQCEHFSDLPDWGGALGCGMFDLPDFRHDGRACQLFMPSNATCGTKGDGHDDR